MGDLVRDFFNARLHNAMSFLNFRNFIVKDFLPDILVWEIDAKSEKSVFSPRKESAVGIRVLAAEAEPEVLNILGKRMLFVLGVFPEHLVATGKCVTDINDYIAYQRVLANRLAPHFGSWQMVDKHFYYTIRSLNIMRLGINIQRPEPNFFQLLQNMIKKYQ
jgi:hypothetical protein